MKYYEDTFLQSDASSLSKNSIPDELLMMLNHWLRPCGDSDIEPGKLIYEFQKAI